MDSASDKFHDSQEDEKENQDLLANLVFWVDKRGEVQYHMDWTEDNDGIQALSKIFYELIHNGYADLILSKMREQCVLNDTELEYESFIKLILNHYPDKINKEGSLNSPIISPEKSAYTI